MTSKRATKGRAADLARALGVSVDAVRHSKRFRKVSNRYPLRVTEAYGGDLRRAAADSDDQVAATVAAWERMQGLAVRDWRVIGREEHQGDPKPPARRKRK